MWICTLPLALFRTFQYLTPLVSATIAFLLIGVENIGVQVSGVSSEAVAVGPALPW